MRRHNSRVNSQQGVFAPFSKGGGSRSRWGDFHPLFKKELTAKRAGGFTLVELVLVIAVLGILSAVAIPKFFTKSPYASRFFYDDVLSSIRYAARYAIGSGCHTQVSLSATTLTLTQRASCTTGAFTVAVPDPGKLAGSQYTRTVPNGTSVSTGGGIWPLYFNGLGQAKQVSNDQINNFTATIDTRTITVTGQTGFIQ